jgi:hypothetical protein
MFKSVSYKRKGKVFEFSAFGKGMSEDFVLGYCTLLVGNRTRLFSSRSVIRVFLYFCKNMPALDHGSTTYHEKMGT